MLAAILAFGLGLGALPAGAAQAPPELLHDLGLAAEGESWSYSPGFAGRRPLTADEKSRVEAFLESLPDEDRDDALAQPLLAFLRARNLPAEGSIWFDGKVPDLRLTDAGRRAVVGRLLGDPLEGAAEGKRADPLNQPISLDRAFEVGDTGGVDFDGAGPSGFLPADLAIAGRGYALPGEGARILGSGELRLSAQLNSSNYLFGEDGAGGRVSQRYETETAALELRAGARVIGVPVEVGVMTKAHRNGGGFQNGMIEKVEKIFGSPNEDRFGLPGLPRGYHLVRGGREIGPREARTGGLGDVLFTVKAAVLDGGLHGQGTRLAARLAYNIPAGRDVFSRGEFLGFGLSLEQPLTGWLRAHADARVTVPLDTRDRFGLPLRPAAVGATVGLEAEFRKGSSIILQVDAQQSPYGRTRLHAFDHHAAGVSLGFNQRFEVGKALVLLQIFGRENFEPRPLRMSHNGDADFQAGAALIVER